MDIFGTCILAQTSRNAVRDMTWRRDRNNNEYTMLYGMLGQIRANIGN